MYQDLLLTFTSLFVAMDIIGAIPMYLALTRDMTRDQRNKIVNLSMAVAFIVAVTFALIGQWVFDHLGITLYDFKVAGGIILLLIGLADLLGGPDRVHHVSASTGIVPLAVPLITGPAILTALVVLIGSKGYLITLTSTVICYTVAYFMLRYCDLILKKVGKEGTVILSKIAALLLAAISVSMIRSGVFDAIRAFQP